MADLDLVALRQMAEDRRPSTGFEPKTVLALLDRIAELERIVHFERHFCRDVDCPTNPPYAMAEHYHCPIGCTFAEHSESALD